jgi:hypothetical protein
LKTCLKKKNRLVEWLRVKALTSSPSTERKKKNKKTNKRAGGVAQVVVRELA